MLKLKIPASEMWYESPDGTDDHFITVPETELSLEHSLVSLSKWESIWHKPFLNDKEKTNEELISYMKCMTLTQNVPDEVYSSLMSNPMALSKVNQYIGDSMTATTIGESNNKKNRDIITSEIIYYWMISLNIPMECQKWHLNRLLMLIQVCSIKNAPQKKMSRSESLARVRRINAARRGKNHSKG